MLAIAKSTLISATLIIASVVAATSEPNRIDFEQDFKALSSIERKNIQSELKSFGDTYYFANGYASNVDGKWGPSTNAALQEAYQYLTEYDTVSKNVTAGLFLNLILQEYEFWLIGSDVGEGCDGCEAEGTDVVYETIDYTHDQSFSDAGTLNANEQELASKEPIGIDIEQDFKALPRKLREQIQINLFSFGEDQESVVGYLALVDGKYGPNLLVDGEWGPSTKNAINEAYRFMTDTLYPPPFTPKLFLSLLLKGSFWQTLYEPSDAPGFAFYEVNGRLILRYPRDLTLNAHDHKIEFPNFATMSSDDYQLTFDLSQYCETVEAANNSEVEIGTEFLGVKLTNSLCSNINILSSRNYKCLHIMSLYVWPIDRFSRTYISVRNDTPVGNVYCENDMNGKIGMYVDAKLSLNQDQKNIDFIPSNYDFMSALLDYQTDAFYNLFNADISKIDFNCHAFNACTTSPIDLVKAIYQAKLSLQKSPIKIVTTDDPLVSIYGEKVSVSAGITFSKLEGPRVSLTRGTIDRYTAKPLEF